MAVAKPLHLRLFLEGIEVPVVSAQVTIGVNGPASAAVQVVPHDRALQFKPRTMVHLFYLDGDPTDDALAAGSVLGDYRLLFSGETIGFNVEMTPMSRGIVLQCVDFSAYWDSCHATAIEYGPGGNAFTDTGWLVGSNTSQFDDIVNQQANKLVGWLGQTPKTPGLTTVTGLAGGIIRMLEAMGGLPGVEKGVNDFFTIAQLRCRILEQLVAEENDSTARRLLSVSVFDEWVRNGLQNAGQQVTFRDLLKILFQYIYYETVPNPVARYVKGTEGRTELKTDVVTATLVQDPNGSASLKELIALRNRITLEAAGGADEQYFRPTVEAYKQTAQKSVARLSAVKSADSAAVRAHLSTLLAKIAALLQLQPPTQDFKKLSALIPPVQSAIDRLLESTKSVVTRTTAPYNALIGGASPRLHTQIIRPDCWFAAPPVCNVIFPEQYATFSYQRNHLSEVTRVLIQLYNTFVGTNRLLTSKILAPNAAQATKRLGKLAPSVGYRVIMDHEVHTGILPKEEFLPDTTSIAADKSDADRLSAKRDRMSWAQRVALFHYFRYRYASRGCSVGGKFNPNVVCGFPAAVLTRSYIPQKVVAATFAAADAFMGDTEQERLRYALDNADDLGAPVHYVGMVGSVSHSLDQRGGTTNVAMHHTRQIGGSDDEFIQMAQSLKTVERTVQITLDFEQIAKMRDSARQEVLLKFLVGVTPQLDTVPGKPATVVKATPKAPVASSVPVTTPNAPAWATGGAPLTFSINQTTGQQESAPQSSTQPATVRERRALPTRVKGGLTKEYAENGKTYVVPNETAKIVRGLAGIEGKGKVKIIEVANAGLIASADVRAVSKGVNGRAFKKVIVHENIDLPVTSKIPAEEIIRPRGWFSEKYANEEIGKGIYDPFFGCLSIIDTLRARLNETTYVANPTSTGEAIIDPTASISMVEAVSFTESEKLFHSVERAMTALAYIYGKVKSEGGDVDAFIRAYTRRPVATKDEILGSEDLTLKINSQSSIEAVSGTFGFFTHAVHRDLVDRTEKLYGLVGDPTLKVSRINASGAASPYLGAYDVRREKWAAVKAYADELWQSKAFQG